MISISALADSLARKETLDAALPADQRLAAAREVLRRAGQSIAPQTRSVKQVFAALLALENLAGLDEGKLLRPFLALRALDITGGNALGGELAADETVQIMAIAGGLVPTLDVSEQVSGVIGEMGERTLETLAPRARHALPGAGLGGFSVATESSTLFAEGGEPIGLDKILRAIDQIPSRNAIGGATAASQAGAAVPLSYEVIDRPAGAEIAGDDVFQAYTLSRIAIPGAKTHPIALIEPAALGSVKLPKPSYQPILDPAIVANGALSDVQLEAIIYAGEAHSRYLQADPIDPNAPAPRQGFLIGHGTGVGKGRILAGIILDNWNQGRRRSIWISENPRLIADARRDWVAVGGRANDVIDLREFSQAQDVPVQSGILFLTYALLRNEERLMQVINWFGQGYDGVIGIDEAQNGRNAMPNGGKFWESNKVSEQGEAMIRLQTTCLNARVTYASATSASKIANLGYGIRLGLFGKGTAFPTPQEFFAQMDAGGLNALELVARDMKSLGIYVSANLSMQGVEFERVEYTLTPDERNMQDTLSAAWSEINVELQRAMISTGITLLAQHKPNKSKQKASGRSVSRYRTYFLMAKSRFFQAFIAALNARRLVDDVADDIRNGFASIVQVTNTFESNLDRAIEADTTGDVSNIESTPKDILIEYIMAQFPVHKHHVVKTGTSSYAMTPIVDKNGDPVICPQAEAARDRLIQTIQALPMPEGPLEQFLMAFGAEQVAEVTGRRRRLVPGRLPGTRVLEERSAVAVAEDIRQFQAGRKNIIIFSTSGAAGASYHAAKGAGNQRRRRHNLLQAGWRTDQALQGLGRSHRADETSAPIYRLVSCDLWAVRRMISTVAAGMESLGALTKGQRHAATQELFSAEDNLESPLAGEAWIKFVKDLDAGNIPNLSLSYFERETGILFEKQAGRLKDTNLPEIRRFLNAMSSMTVERQEAFGTAFKRCLDEVKLEAIRKGTFDRGIETLVADSIIKLEDDVIHVDAQTGAETRLLKMLRRDKITPVGFTEARRAAVLHGSTRMAVNRMTNRVAILAFPVEKLLDESLDEIMVATPRGIRTKKRYQLERESWILASPDEAKRLWEIELDQLNLDEETVFSVVTGTLLPIWDKLPRENVVVYRMEADDGEQILGRLLPDDFADRLVTRVNAMAGQAIDPKIALGAIEAGEIVSLANGWIVEGRIARLTGKLTARVILLGEKNSAGFADELRSDGCLVREHDDENTISVFLPEDSQAREAAFINLTARRPVVGITSLSAVAA